MNAGLTQLHTLANLYGIRTAYLDMTGRTRPASADSLLAALKALGAPIGGTADIPFAIKEKHRLLWLEPLEPVIAISEDTMLTFNLKLPASCLNSPVKGSITLENGEMQELFWRMQESSITHSITIDGKPYYNIRLYLPGKIPGGYHRLVLELPGQNVQALVISSPLKAFQPPLSDNVWGIFTPVYALHSAKSWGAGDFSDLKELMEWTAQRGGRFIGTLPLLAGFFDKDYGPGPYLPASRFFWNEF
jgi:4-alpha-glucanotransferase